MEEVHSDALADNNKIPKIWKIGDFQRKTPFLTPKKAQKS